ncbi:MAG: protein kinase [Gemmatimonadota bacterium]
MTPIGRDRWEALSPLFDIALTLTGAERSAWLEAQRQSDPGLAAALAELLDHEARIDGEGFLSPEVRPGVPARITSLAGRRLGAWMLERPLGQGGMGTVWLARRADGRFEGQAAVKLLNLALVSARGQERFRQEGSVLARLTHPGIARLLDAGMSEGGQPYLVLEFVDGQPIDAYVRARSRAPAELLPLFLQVLAAVGHAHSNLVVHRDLKPSNIFIAHDGTVKLLDFGIAKLLDIEAGTDRTPLTAEGGRALTPLYAAPEQVCGDPLTTATDVYALGVLLYLLLSGRHPTAAEGSSPAEWLASMLEVDPPRLGLGDLDTVLGKALRKEPAERYQTVAAFGDDLARYLRQEPVSARADSLAYRMGKFVRRNRGAVLAAAVVTVALLVTTGVAVRQSRAARRERDQAVLGLKRQVVMNAVQEVIGGDERDANGQPLSSAERVQMAARVVETKYAAEPALVAEALANLSNHYYGSGDRLGARALLARAQSLARRHHLPVHLAMANCLRVYTFAFDEVFDSAAAELAEAKAALASETEPNDEVRVACLDAEGQLLAAQGEWGTAIPLLTRALEGASVTPETGSIAGTRRLQILGDLAAAMRGAGRTRDAATYQTQIVAEMDSTGYGLTDMVPATMSFLASSLLELGEFAVADSIMRHLIVEQEAVRGAGHAAPALAYQYGANLLRLGRFDSAEVWMRRGVQDDPSAPEANSGPRIWAPANLVELRLLQGRVAEARREYQRLPTGTFPRRVAAAWLGAWIRYAAGDSLGAARELEVSIRLLDSVTPHSPRLVLPLLSAAEWRASRGEWGESDSIAVAARRYAGVDSLAFLRSAHVGRAELHRARALLALGQRDEARQAARRAVVALASGYGPDHPRTRAAKALVDSLE